jgi:cathepsin X
LRHCSDPSNFTWGNKDGVNYLTPSLNQHIPQCVSPPSTRPHTSPPLGLALPFLLSWPRLRADFHRARCLPWRRRYCGSCWSHGSVSALGDRIKIARKAKGADVQLSVQHMLNCGGIGSCYGGSVDGPYQWIYKLSQSGTGISYATSQPYVACSSDSKGGLCVNHDWSCTPLNVARTCPTFGEDCVGLSSYPNATVSDHGHVSGAKAMMKEIYNRGPIACGIDANPLLKYTSGIAKGFSLMTDHVVSVVGWGTDPVEGQYWIVRNSWYAAARAPPRCCCLLPAAACCCLLLPAAAARAPSYLIMN